MVRTLAGWARRWRELLLASALLLVACDGGGRGYTLIDVSRSNLGGDFSFSVFSEGGIEPRRLSDFRGTPVVLFFGFLNCPDVCPTEMAKMAAVVERLSPGDMPQVIFITVDPERDTPEALSIYARQFHPDFIGAAVDPTQLSQAARRYGVFYDRVAQGEDFYTMNHSSNLYFLDRESRLRLIARTEDTVDMIAHDIELLSREVKTD